MDIAKEALDRAIKRLQNLPNHAGRPSWDKIVFEELNDVIAQKNAEIERLREALTLIAMTKNDDIRPSHEIIKMIWLGCTQIARAALKEGE